MEVHSRLLNISQMTVLPQKSNKKSETCKIERKSCAEILLLIRFNSPIEDKKTHASTLV